MGAGPQWDPYGHTPTPAQAFERARRRHLKDRATLNSLDRRGVAPTTASRRSNKTLGYLDGIAVVYDTPAVIHEGGVTLREVIRPGSLRLPPGGRDVVSRMNHDPNQHLGRTASGSLAVTDTPQGVKFRVRLPDTTAGHDVAELVQARELRGASFMFSIPDGGQTFRRGPDGSIMREVRTFTLYELGPVVSPAYLETTVGHDVGIRSDEQAASAVAGRVLWTLDWTQARSCAAPTGLRKTEIRYADLQDIRLEAA